MFFLAMLGALTVAAPLTAGSGKPEVVLQVLVQDTELTDPTKVVRLQLENPPEVVNFSRLPVVSQKYLWNVHAQPDGSVVVQFDSIGADALEVATRINMGKIMVVVFRADGDEDGRVLLAAVIDSPLTGGRLRLHGLTASDIKKIQSFITRRRAT
jgi:preprotein translocase subunit SecD